MIGTKHRIRYKTLLFLVLSYTSLAHAQTFYALQIDRNIRFKAADITRAYQPHLVMGSEQALIFKQTVAKFLVKRKSIETNPALSPNAKYSLLKQISSRETSEMADVLESYRWQEYMRIKENIQPIPKPHPIAQELIVHKDERQ
ncbi:hypothetical protein [Kriegella aquimaris]|uniref:Uncharacterized protein n=1 Tax=Kriegella aquimaris TaxID=192904 RepID=A0A1G9IEG9_9FLAO|nr:hypothetical protein [Kriegella aquimaris]SDL23506.1 hypothetical protein SAMN04488514_101104 [Kriegella aquimaris]